MTAELLARFGGPVAAGGLALLVLATPRQARLGGLLVWALGMALFLPLLAPSGHWALGAAAVVFGAGLAVGLAFLFQWQPWALAFLTLAAVPARLPVSVGDVSANLLVPLYGIIAGAAVGLAWSFVRGDTRSRELGALSWPLALFIGWLGLSALWTNDPREGAVQLFFFILPFPVLALALARLPWSERALGWLLRLLGAMAVLFAAVGLWQWVTRDVFWNPKVIAGNAYAPFFRVNSLFWDPSIYGRFLVTAILAALVLLLFALSQRWDVWLIAGIGFLWLGLLVSFSQSSFAALIAGVALAAALAWRWRAAAAVTAVAGLMIATGLGAPSSQDAKASVLVAQSSDLERATRGRSDLVWNGLRIAARHPVAGVGIGGFEQAYLERYDPPPGLRNPVSHTTPITVVAETGLIGLGLFAWLLATAAIVAFRRAREGPAPAATAGIAAGVGIAAILVHSFFYNAFLEDPMTWGLLALAALAAATSAAVRA
jgi:O-antigen ligase